MAHHGSVIQGYFPNGPVIGTQRSSHAAQPRPEWVQQRVGLQNGSQAAVTQPRLAQPAPHAPIVQRLANGTATQLPAHLANIRTGGGQPLPAAVRQKMEALFGASFGDVRVHIGPEAAAIGALAFTRGSDIHFAPGHYDPTTHRGRQILGHELAHVRQQKMSRVRNPFGSGVAVVHDAFMEAEAERMGARAAAAFSPADIRTAPNALPIQRKAAGPARVGGRSRVIQRHPMTQVKITEKTVLRESFGGRSLAEGKTAFEVSPSASVVIDKGDVWDSRLGPDLKTSSMFTYRWFRVVAVGGNDLQTRDIYVPGGTFDEEVELTPAPIPSVGVFKGPVRTFGGTWRAVEYNSKMGVNNKTARGAHMKLEFTPEYPADATEIVLVQTVQPIKNSKPYYQNKTIGNRSYKGISIDHWQDSISFAYASVMDELSKIYVEIDDEKGPIHAGQHGYRYKQYNGWFVQTAWLVDNPALYDVEHGSYSGQIFETTALAIKGNDQGTYYGSVKWGWEAKEGKEITLIPLQVASYGSASPVFHESAMVWNKTQSSEGKDPLQLPQVPRLEV